MPFIFQALGRRLCRPTGRKWRLHKTLHNRVVGSPFLSLSLTHTHTLFVVIWLSFFCCCQFLRWCSWTPRDTASPSPYSPLSLSELQPMATRLCVSVCVNVCVGVCGWSAQKKLFPVAIFFFSSSPFFFVALGGRFAYREKKTTKKEKK